MLFFSKSMQHTPNDRINCEKNIVFSGSRTLCYCETEHCVFAKRTIVSLRIGQLCLCETEHCVFAKQNIVSLWNRILCRCDTEHSVLAQQNIVYPDGTRMVLGWYPDGTRMVRGWYSDGTRIVKNTINNYGTKVPLSSFLSEGKIWSKRSRSMPRSIQIRDQDQIKPVLVPDPKIVRR